MHSSTWKEGERRIARIFNTNRTPLSGGNSRHTRSDTLHKELFIEVKHRKVVPGEGTMKIIEQLAKEENKIPLCVFIKKGSSEPLLLCKLKDIKKIASYITDNIK